MTEVPHDSLRPFLVTSVPKSGTYLLHQLLIGMPNITSEHRHAKRFISTSDHVKDYYNDHFTRLAMLKENEFGIGHVRYSKAYVGMLRSLNMKHVFLYRDPRDVLVSMSYFIKEKWKTHKLYDDFQKKYPTQKHRLIVLIRGVKRKWPDFYTYNVPYYQWLNERSSYLISFEDLMKSSKSRHHTLTQLTTYLWSGLKPSIPLEQMVQIMNHQLTVKPTVSTFRSGRIGAWRREFDEEIKQEFKRNAGRLLIEAGYEKNDRW